MLGDNQDMRVQHFVLTRFNVRFAFFMERYGWSGADPAYLDQRFALFEKNCLPAMKRQAVPFRWLVFFSKSTPDAYKERARGYVRECPSFEAVFVDDDLPIRGADMQETFYRYVAERLDADAEWVITTRIDNDDAFNVHALMWIRASVEEYMSRDGEKGAFFVALPNGNAWLAAYSFTQSYSWKFNHFPSYVCPRAERCQVLAFNHVRIKSCGLPIVLNPAGHAWLEIVSGTNLKNGFRPSCRACRMSSQELREAFAIDADISRLRGLLFYLMRYLPARMLWRLRCVAKRFSRLFGTKG